MTKTKLIGGGAILIVLFTLSYTKADTVVYKASEPSLPHPEATAVAAATTYTATDISELKSILTNLTALVGHLIDQQAHQSLTYTSNTRSSRDAADADFTVKQADRIYETIGDNLDETNDSLSSLTDRVDTLRDDLASLTLSVSSSTPKYYAESTSTPSTAPQVTGSRSVAIGDGSYVSGSGSIALGDHVSVTGNLSVAVGAYAAATTWNTFAFGYGAFASGVFSQAIGSLNNVSGYAASAFGFQNTVSGAGASAFGSSLTNSIGTSTMIGPSNAAKLTILGAAGSVGFVGIGTTTPSAKLHVTGTAGSSDIFALSSSTNTRLLTVTSAGKVGIGTSTPSETLTVNGSLLTTGHVAMGNRAKVDGVFIDTFYPPSTSYHAILSIAEEVTSLPVGATKALGMNVALLANPASGTPLSSYRGAVVDVETDGGNNQNIGVLNGSYTQAAHVGSGNAAGLYAQEAFSYHAGSGTVTNQSGVWSELGVVGSGIVNNARLFEGSLFTSGGGGTINVATAFKGDITTYGSSDTINTARGVYVAIDNSAGGTITNAYGLYIDTIAGTNNWGLYQANAGNKNYFAGNLGIGTTTPTQKLSVVGNAQFTGVTSGAYAADLNLTADGTLTTASSDRRLKDNETLLDTKDTLTKLLTLAPKSFTWKETGTTDIGFIAQDVEPIFPELVFTNPNDGYMGINYSRLPALIVAAIQEMWMMLTRHEEDIELLKTENDTLKEENGELKNRLRVIENELDITHNTDTEGPEEGDEEMSDGEPPVPEAPAEEGKPTPETLDEDSTHAEDETPAEETENPAPAPES